jgi:multidrug efflux pump subunit AcrA (membrane-fusion protein)
MKKITKKTAYIISGVLIAIVLIALTIWFRVLPDNSKTWMVKRGNLELLISGKGEVRGEKYVEIKLAEEICDRNLHIYQLKIVDLVSEGKPVKQGDYIAKLDESQISSMMSGKRQEKERYDSDLRNARIDSSVNLSRRREAITNARLDLEYLNIDLEQSKYESEAYQRKTQMKYQKAELEVEKIKRDYLLDKNKWKMQVSRYEDRVVQLSTELAKYAVALEKTTITAPQNGIVMFAKDWNGKTYGKESEVNIWNPLIAVLPDMSVVITETYIKEIEISKIESGDPVRIKIDALPDKVFSGKVVKVANIGEEHKDFDMKAFKVVIRFDKSDKALKPGMNANCEIIIETYSDQLLIPRKAVFSKEGKRIVYAKRGGKIVELNIEMEAENDEFVLVKNDIHEGDLVLLYQPEEFSK